jgi:hypothetical protein
MKIQLLLSGLFLLNLTAFAQTIAVFKPGPATGDHALLMTTYGCVLNGNSAATETVNGSSSPDMHYGDWSYSSIGCGHGTLRELLRFTGLNSIPSNAVILDAKLRLYGVPSSMHTPNSSYPGSPFTTTNEGWVKRVTGTWSNTSVTWNSQPATTSANQVAIPKSDSQWNWHTTLNVTNLVKDIQSSGQNSGFMFMLQNEQPMRHTEFASSNHTDSTLWPELEVTYQLPQGISNISGAGRLFVYPNPATTQASLLLPTYLNGNTTLRITDITGRVIMEQQVIANGKELYLDIAAFAKGVYIVRAEAGQGIATAKLTLQ